jgi:hypothetical protein
MMAGCSASPTSEEVQTSVVYSCTGANAENAMTADVASYESKGTALTVFVWGRPGEELTDVCVGESDTEVRVTAKRLVPEGQIEDMRIALSIEIELRLPVGERAVVDGQGRPLPLGDAEGE